MKIYLAGPLFTTAEREFNSDLATALQFVGQEVWLPQDHEPRDKTTASIFAEDLRGLQWCDAVVANMDGPDPDSGTAWEVGWAFASKKIIGIYRTDFRKANDMPDAMVNLMLSGSATFAIECPMAGTLAIAAAVNSHLLAIERTRAPAKVDNREVW